jgi:hypothetical protein
MDISASILKSSKPEQQVHLSTRHTKDLEEWIEEYSRQLPPLEKYVIPVSFFHFFNDKVGRYMNISFYISFLFFCRTKYITSLMCSDLCS